MQTKRLNSANVLLSGHFTAPWEALQDGTATREPAVRHAEAVLMLYSRDGTDPVSRRGRQHRAAVGP